VYGPAGDAIRKAMVDGFRQAFPDIAVEWLGGRTADLANKIEAERRAALYSGDVLIGGTTTANNQMKPIGALDPIRPALLLPEVLDTSRWLGGRLDFSDREELNLVFAVSPKVQLLYDPKQVAG
jgi:iron(III) transport system substrate-binding protein